jgi:nucleoside-diphosphate-sugar epimerase
VAPDRPAIVVTGSSGFIGRALCTALLRDGHRVIGLDRPDGGDPPAGVVNVSCDVTSQDSVDAAVLAIRDQVSEIASVVHLAAYYDFSGEPSPQYEAVTIHGTERLLRALTPLHPQQFLFSSTMLVHAPCLPGEHINESWPVHPAWDYPKSKLAAEQAILAGRENVPVVLARIAGVYTDECNSIPLANQIQRIYEKRLTAKVFPGDIHAGQSFLHLNDLIGAIRAAIARRAQLPTETTVLLGEEDPMSYDDLQRSFAWLIHGERDWETTQIPKAVAKAGSWVQDTVPGVEEPFIKPWMIDLADEHYALDVNHARTLLAWSPGRQLRETLALMCSALFADPARWYRRNKLHGDPPSVEKPVSHKTR